MSANPQHPDKYREQKTEYVGGGTSIDHDAAGYDRGSDSYRQYILSLRDKNFTAVGGTTDDEWRLVEEKGTGRRFWRHKDLTTGQYDLDLVEATDQNDPVSLAPRQAPPDAAGVYDEGERVTARPNPYPPGTAEHDDFARAEYARILGVRDSHYAAADPADAAGGEAEWRALRENTSGHLRQRHRNALTGFYDLALGKAYDTGKGAVGGAGNRVTGQSADNRWDETVDGADQRTDVQKYYDHDYTGYQEVADALGTYSWYGTEADKATGQKVTRNLDTYKDPISTGASDSHSGERQYWDFNGAPDESWFRDQVRARPNKSIYSRTY